MEYSLERGLELIDNIKSEKVKRETIREICAILIDAGLINKAMELLQKIDEVDDAWVNYKLAQKYIENLEIEKARNIADKLDDDLERTWRYMDMAESLFKNGRYEEAIKLVDEIENIGDLFWGVYSLIDFAKISLKRNDIKMTKKICAIIENKLKLIDKTYHGIPGAEFEKSGITYEIAKIYRKIGNEEKSEYYYNIAIKILEDLVKEIDDDTTDLLIELAKIKYELGFREEAYKIIKENKGIELIRFFDILVERDPIIEEIIEDNNRLFISYLEKLMHNQYQENGRIESDLLSLLSKIDFEDRMVTNKFVEIASILKKAGFDKESRKIVESIEQIVLKENAGFEKNIYVFS